MTEDPIETVKALDRYWHERKFDELAALLAPNVVVVGAHGRRFAGPDAVLSGYRDFAVKNVVGRYAPINYVATTQGDTAVVEYEWTMEWSSGEQNHRARGREILVLTCMGYVWRIMWRTQIPLASPG